MEKTTSITFNIQLSSFLFLFSILFVVFLPLSYSFFIRQNNFDIFFFFPGKPFTSIFWLSQAKTGSLSPCRETMIWGRSIYMYIEIYTWRTTIKYSEHVYIYIVKRHFRRLYMFLTYLRTNKTTKRISTKCLIALLYMGFELMFWNVICYRDYFFQHFRFMSSFTDTCIYSLCLCLSLFSFVWEIK